MQQRGAVANSAKGAWGENSAPFVFRTPLLGSPPSTVCPSPVKRSFRESISRRTVMLAQWQFISQQTPLVNQHLTINAGSRANVYLRSIFSMYMFSNSRSIWLKRSRRLFRKERGSLESWTHKNKQTKKKKQQKVNNNTFGSAIKFSSN